MTPDQWTPPERIWVEPPLPGRSVLLADAAPDEDLDDEVEYVLASALDALREENARLKAKGLDDFTVTGDEYDRLLDERDALRARVEELEAGLRDAIEEVGCAPVAHMPHLAHQAQVSAASVDRWRALLSGGSRPDTDETCPNCCGFGSIRGCAEVNRSEAMTCDECKGSGRRPDTKETKT